MKITEGRLRLSASDVANFLACQQLTQLRMAGHSGEDRPCSRWPCRIRPRPRCPSSPCRIRI